MDLSASIPVVTGAGRGLGRHLVDALLERGATKVYALARDTSTVRSDPRVVAVRFDLRDADSIAAAAQRAADATLLINNASTAAFATPARGRPGRGARARSPSTSRALRDDPRVRPGARSQRRRADRQRPVAAEPRQHARRWPATPPPRRRLTRSPRRCARCSPPRGITRPRRLPGRDRHRHARRHRRAEDAARRRRQPASSPGSPQTRRTSSPTPTPRRCPRSGGATPRRSNGPSPIWRPRREHPHPASPAWSSRCSATPPPVAGRRSQTSSTSTS